MKRTEFKARKKPMKKRNPKRAADTYKRNFGDRGDPVRAMGCLCNKGLCEELRAADTQAAQDAAMSRWCSGPIQAAHAIARGMGGAKGDRRTIVPLCHGHHAEAGERNSSARAAFEKRYGLDLIAEAERIAVELDARGLA